MLPFGRWWRQAQVPVLGVDIGAGGVRVVEFTRGRHPCVAHYAHQPLPHGAIRDGAIVMPDVVCDALRTAVHDSGSRLRHAALALPAGVVIMKTLTIPTGLSDDELELQVEAEAEASLPFARDEMGIDFAVTGPNAQQPEAVDVMLVAARREKIDERTGVAEAAGLKPLIVDVESHALMSAVALFDVARGAREPQLIAALQLDPDRSHCFFMLDGALLYERELGPVMLRKETAAIDAICQEFNRALQLFQTATGHSQLHHVYLLGVVPHELAEALAHRMKLQVSLPDPRQRWSGDASPELGEHPSACMLACGLALRGVES
jgi:type IV pilus assembly protein PilM